MGIPSYYKKLCDTIPGLLSRIRNSKKPVTHLWIDFNCMIYHCLRKPGAPVYLGSDQKLAYEKAIYESVSAYLKKVVTAVGPTKQVYIAVDGVVPMAKIRQQRLRRFKSPWLAEQEVACGKPASGPRWDTNAITPGTAFMEGLGHHLSEACQRHGTQAQWILSGADEPGEGEHKIMHQLRNLSKLGSDLSASHVVYGLDADLIVLCLLQLRQSALGENTDMYLFREAVECGEVQYKDNEEEYRYFNIVELHKALLKQFHKLPKDTDAILEYAMAMSFLGNDFLPHSLSLKLRDGGHTILFALINHVHSTAGSFLTKEGSWRRDAILSALEWLAKNETEWITKSVHGKMKQRWQAAQGTGWQLELDELMKRPLRQFEESSLLGNVKRTSEGTQIQLRTDWADVYRSQYLSGASETAVVEYLRGLDWIRKYYLGETVALQWCFPWFTTPLWSDLLTYVKANATLPRAEVGREIPLTPKEQLALVLPLSSWNLLRCNQLQQVPQFAPQYWPSEFELFTLGRKILWECEAKIPLLTPQRLRSIVSLVTPAANSLGKQPKRSVDGGHSVPARSTTRRNL